MAAQLRVDVLGPAAGAVDPVRARRRRRAAEAAHVVADQAMPAGERAPLRIPHAAVADAGMDEDEGRPVPGGLGMDSVGAVHSS